MEQKIVARQLVMSTERLAVSDDNVHPHRVRPLLRRSVRSQMGGILNPEDQAALLKRWSCGAVERLAVRQLSLLCLGAREKFMGVFR